MATCACSTSHYAQPKHTPAANTTLMLTLTLTLTSIQSLCRVQGSGRAGAHRPAAAGPQPGVLPEDLSRGRQSVQRRAAGLMGQPHRIPAAACHRPVPEQAPGCARRLCLPFMLRYRFGVSFASHVPRRFADTAWSHIAPDSCALPRCVELCCPSGELRGCTLCGRDTTA